jgi:hypothetical protein
MRRTLLFLALTGFVSAALAMPSTARARDADRPMAPVALVAPAAGATLTAGTTAELEWAPLAGYARLARVEEWEAFLSLDGGATYPVRVTPHLDQDLRRVRWQVPATPAADARLLLRFGDERREVAIELPQRFAIVASPATTPSFLLARVSPTPGEAPLAGEPGVVAWVAGTRRGGALRQVVAAARPGWQARVEPASPADETAMLADGRAPLPLPEPARERAARERTAGPPSRLASAGEGPLQAFDILLLTQRKNE